MKNIFTAALATATVLLAGCGKEPPPPPPKQQKVIFDASGAACRGSELCEKMMNIAERECIKISVRLSGQLNQGWRVVSSSPKERGVINPVQDSIPTAQLYCPGTEYILEK